MSSTASSKRAAPPWLVACIASVFGLFYAYAVWAGVQYLIVTLEEISRQQEMLGADVALTPIAWIALVMAILVPIAAFAIAMVLGRGKAVWKLALLLLVGLALTSVFWLDVQAFTMTARIIA